MIITLYKPHLPSLLSILFPNESELQGLPAEPIPLLPCFSLHQINHDSSPFENPISPLCSPPSKLSLDPIFVWGAAGQPFVWAVPCWLEMLQVRPPFHFFIWGRAAPREPWFQHASSNSNSFLDSKFWATFWVCFGGLCFIGVLVSNWWDFWVILEC